MEQTAVNFRILFYFSVYLINALFVGSAVSIVFTISQFILVLVAAKSVNRRYFSLEDMFIISYYIFFVIAPLQSIGSDGGGYSYFKWGPVEKYYFENGDFLIASAIVSIFLLSFLVFKNVISLKDSSSYISQMGNDEPLYFKQKTIMLFSFSCIMFLLYIVTSGGLSNVLASRFLKENSEAFEGAVFFLGFMSVGIYMHISLVLREAKKFSSLSFIPILILLIILAVACNPFNSPRFFLIGCWVPVAFLFFKGKLPAFNTYVAVFLAVIFFLPVLSLTSRMGVEGIYLLDFSELLQNIFSTPYADVFDTLVYLVKYVENNGYTFGSNTLGIFTFFVPRSIWVGKPEVMAIELGQDMVYFSSAGTSNLSMFFSGEMYMDFNFFGVIVSGLFAAVFIRALEGREREEMVSFRDILSYTAIGAAPILIRGPMMAILPLFFSQMVSYFFLKKMMDFINSDSLKKKKYHFGD